MDFSDAIDKIKNAARLNAIFSRHLGINVSGEDPTKYIQFEDNFLSGAEARNVYRNLDVIHRVIDAPVYDALRNGFVVKTNYDEDLELGRLLMERLESLNIKSVLTTFLTYSRLFSRGVAVYPVLAEFGDGSLEYGLNLNDIDFVRSINVIPEDFLSYRVQNIEPLARDFGDVTDFFIRGQRVDKSRFFFYAQNFDVMRQRGVSVLERVRAACVGIAIAEWTITQLLLRYRALIVKYPADELGRVKLGERAGLKQRIVELINTIKTQFTAKSVVGVPSNYDFQYLETTFTGLHEATDYLFEYLSAVTKIPQNILRGSAKGELASSEKDQRDYYAMVQSEEQQLKIEPLLQWLFPFIIYERSGKIRAVCEDAGVDIATIDPNVEFKPLHVESPLGQAQIKLTKAQYYSALAQGGLLPKDFLQSEILSDLFPHVDSSNVVGFDGEVFSESSDAWDKIKDFVEGVGGGEDK